MGGTESSSKHTAGEPYPARKDAGKPQPRVGLAVLPGREGGRSLGGMNVATLHRLPSLRSLASTPHRGLVEVATIVGLYGLYEAVRGQGHASLAAAREHTRRR